MKKTFYYGGALALGLAWLLAAGCGTSSSDTVSFSPASAQTTPVTPTTPPTSQDPTVALAALKAGNARYVAGTNQVLVRSQDRPLILNETQAPEAAILSCADSRVDPELAFDQAWGQLFTVRVAGPVADFASVGSLEFAVGALGTRLIVVLGHEQCGACNAALGNPPLPPGNLFDLVQLIVPAANSVRGLPGDPLENCIKANVALQAARLRSTSKPIDEAVASGKVVIQGALYHLATGEIEFFNK